MKVLLSSLLSISIIPISIICMLWGWGLTVNNWGWIAFSYVWMFIAPALIREINS